MTSWSDLFHKVNEPTEEKKEDMRMDIRAIIRGVWRIAHMTEEELEAWLDEKYPIEKTEDGVDETGGLR
jgi:hypothetical protein